MTSNLVFVHIPKNAGGAIKRWFWDNNIPNFYASRHHSLLNRIVEKNNLKTYTSFAVVRNTYKRIVSLYNWSEIKARKAIKKGRNIDHFTKILELHSQGIIPWFEYIHKDHDTLTQIDYIKNVDYVLKHESLTEDFRKIQNIVNYHSPLRRTKHKQSYDYNTFISNELIDLIDNYYKEEIDLFDYKP